MSDRSDAPAGVDLDNVTGWLADRVEALTPPLEAEIITGGHSNLTFRLTDADGHRWVLRRPPLKQVLATAHDMGREARMLEALAPTPVPVPPVVGLCTDESVNGAPFYVMDFVDGRVIHNRVEADELSAEQQRRAGESIVDVLAAIHAVDIDAVGLGDFAKREDYIARQLKRWQGQFEKSTTRDVPVMAEVYDRLHASIPPQREATIVHADYRLDNCMIGPDGDVIAVLDWEICTLGDPLADVGTLLVYWGDPDDPARAVLPTPTLAPGFPKPAEVLERYAAASGRDVEGIEYFVAFALWRLACIVEGVYSRYVGGAMGDHDPSSFEFFGEQVILLAESARKQIDALG